MSQQTTPALDKRHALITGASQGLGLAIAQALLQEHAQVTNWSRSQLSYTHPKLTHIPCDCQQINQVEQAWTQTPKPSPDIVIYNSGIGYYGNLEDMPTSAWDTLMATNLHGAFYTLKQVIPTLKAQKKGHILLVGSVASKQGSAKLGAYCASKFALKGLAESLMLELRYDNIKVTYLAPGSIETPFFDKLQGLSSTQKRMDAACVAQSVVQLLQTAPNYLPSYVEVRPLRP